MNPNRPIVISPIFQLDVLENSTKSISGQIKPQRYFGDCCLRDTSKCDVEAMTFSLSLSSLFSRNGTETWASRRTNTLFLPNENNSPKTVRKSWKHQRKTCYIQGNKDETNCEFPIGNMEAWRYWCTPNTEKNQLTKTSTSSKSRSPFLRCKLCIMTSNVYSMEWGRGPLWWRNLTNTTSDRWSKWNINSCQSWGYSIPLIYCKKWHFVTVLFLWIISHHPSLIMRKTQDKFQ